ncbi:SOS response-associated peptidase [Ancylobacter terrae]|uniref:SOS response-associated peptidase n=1 Tax=Ancylobacter sp. sgz301288 TaxID=3342077 RepID=UPI00385D4FF0
MCGRIIQHQGPLTYAERFGLDTRDTRIPNLPPRCNGAPSQDILVIRRNPETARAELGALRWGLVPVWSSDLKIAWKTINARAETVATTPAFRGAWKARRRCIVPVDGFYEWRREGKQKQPFMIARKDGKPLALAGLWEGWRDPQSGEWLRTFTILTCDASPFMAPLHDRMPVILEEADVARWLESDDVASLLRPYGPDDLAMWPVSTRVNSPANEGPDLVEPITLPAA